MDQPRVPAGSSKGGEFASKTGTSITEEQGATAAEYQQRGAELNSSLRGSGWWMSIPSERARVDHLDILTGRDKVTEPTLYRAIPAYLLKKIRVGSKIHDSAFVSTTKTMSAVEERITEMSGPSSSYAIMIIKVKLGQTGMDMNNTLNETKQTNYYEHQQEVVLPRGLSVLVTKIEKAGKFTTVHVE